VFPEAAVTVNLFVLTAKSLVVARDPVTVIADPLSVMSELPTVEEPVNFAIVPVVPLRPPPVPSATLLK